jgi:hypothetical protein
VIAIVGIVAKVTHFENTGIKAVKTSQCGLGETPIAWENTAFTPFAIRVLRARPRIRDETLQGWLGQKIKSSGGLVSRLTAISEDVGALVPHVPHLQVQMGSEFVLKSQIPGVNRGNADTGGQSVEHSSARRYCRKVPARARIPGIRCHKIHQGKM